MLKHGALVVYSNLVVYDVSVVFGVTKVYGVTMVHSVEVEHGVIVLNILTMVYGVKFILIVVTLWLFWPVLDGLHSILYQRTTKLGYVQVHVYVSCDSKHTGDMLDICQVQLTK